MFISSRIESIHRFAEKELLFAIVYGSLFCLLIELQSLSKRHQEKLLSSSEEQQ
jgi:hypothetical protein